MSIYGATTTMFLNLKVIYLSLIQLPNTNTKLPFHILWHRLEEDKFDVMDGFKLVELVIGRLPKEFVEALERAYLHLYHSVTDARSSFRFQVQGLLQSHPLTH
ncbi:hypothetical protein BDP27DRAFT_1360505 [Rhodocollybia butyracea]|uniref:Uncharacterized protein n=1 Tax=Rhodocollybia butyracea TaxID=206335 RepID=A0A9P5Q0V7_9AGAR|nr:hypothetical protein BDP27DRAFT_1360505 [Rhodocollybia butyracea]